MTTVTSTNSSNITAAAASDAVRIEAERAVAAVAPLVGAAAAIDLDKIGADEARKLMSAEHKALGYRPPPGSLAAEAQAAAAKHPDSHIDVPASVLRDAAVEDAARIAAERKVSGTGSEAPAVHAGIDLEKVGEAEARTLMSAEHKALGYRPPPGSLAAEAQAAAAKHPEVSAGIPTDALREAAREDAARIAKQRDPEVAPTVGASIDLAQVGEADAATIESAEHKALGYRPPPESLSAAAHAAASQHPTASSGASKDDLEAAGRDDALRIHEERGEVPVETPGVEFTGGFSGSGSVAGVSLDSIGKEDAQAIQSAEQKALGYRPPSGSLAAQAQKEAAKHPHASAPETKDELQAAAASDAAKLASGGEASTTINLNTITRAEAKELQSEEQKILGYRPPAGSIAAEAQHAADKHANTVATKENASTLQSEEQKDLGYRPTAGSAAAVAQSLADKNAQDGGERKLGEAGL